MTATFLFRFTPSVMEPEALEAIFVQREAIVQRVLDLTRASALTSSKHHTLLIGPRGIGKTHGVSLVYHRVKAIEDLREKLLIAWMREEEWGITSLLDLIMRIFRALAAEYKDAGFDERVEALYGLPAGHIETAAGKLLKQYVGDRTLLILIENLDDIFQGLGDEGQKRLRAYIQENPFFTIVATAQSLFNGVSLQTSPFYGFFHIQHLEGLSLEESNQLLASIARYRNDPALESFIRTPTGRARIRAVNHLAGGNHRVYVIFSQFLTRESLDELVEPFMRMLDDLTPYYQDRMRWLSPQQRKIVEFLLNRRSPATVKEISQRCFMTHQTASGQLKVLREMEYVRADALGRESYYELCEPLMRLCVEVKKSRGEPIGLFIDFLRLWYSKDELHQRLESLKPEAALEREYVMHALKAIEGDATDPRVAACLKDFHTYHESNFFAKALEVTDELLIVRGNPEDWLFRGECLFQLDRLEDALESLRKAIEMDPDIESAWFTQGWVLQELGNQEESLKSFEKAIALEPKNWTSWYSRGQTLSQLGRYEEGLESFNKAIEFNAHNSSSWAERGTMLGILGRDEAALSSFDEAIKVDPNNHWAWKNRGAALGNMGRYEEALPSCDKAIELGERSPHVFFNRAECLLALNHWDKGKVALDDALSQFAHADKPATGDKATIIKNLFSTRKPAEWKTRVADLMELFEKHQVVSALGVGLAQSLSVLGSEMVSDAAARAWRDVWQELASDRREFKLPLRLLDVAVRYREKKDQRVLLELPIEERELLNQVFNLEEHRNVKTV
jgi:tetratricopeptide (TPR) repeat protein